MQYTKGKFVFRKLTTDDIPEVIRITKQFYLPQVPDIAVFQVNPAEVENLYEERAKTIVKCGAALGCFHVKSGTPACVALSRVLTDNNESDLMSSQSYAKYSESAQTWIRFREVLGKNLLATLNARRVYHKGWGVVDPKFAKHGLFVDLDVFGDRVAEELECEYAVAELVSVYSQRVARDCLLGILGSENLRPNLKLSPLHTKAQLVCRKLPILKKSAL